MKAANSGERGKYSGEVQERWGQTEAYQEHAEKTKHYSKEQWNHLAMEMDEIFAAFAVYVKQGAAPDSAQVQSLPEKLMSHITVGYYTCSNEILAGLGQMYAADERFKNHIDRHGEGTAEFVGKAIEHYCAK